MLKFVLASLATLALAAPQARAQVFHAVKAFTYTENSDTSTWSYRYSSTETHDNTYTLLSSVDPEGGQPYCVLGTTTRVHPRFWNTGTHEVPVIGVNRSTNEWGFCGAPDQWFAKTVLMHPGNGGLVVLSFLVPADGVAFLQFDFTHIQPGSQHGIRWTVDLNTATLRQGTLFTTNAASPATTGLRRTSLTVHQGDRINFTVAPNPYYAGNSTTLTARVRIQ